MAFEVRLTAAAKRDIRDAMDFFQKRSPRIASKWFAGLFEALETLQEMPHRHAFVFEAAQLKRLLRGLPYYSHRVIYEVDESAQTVWILRIYHTSRAPLELESLQ